jgi:type 1 fimbria pilin
LSGSALISDTGGFFDSGAAEEVAATVAATPSPDTTNVGRYLPSPLAVTVGESQAVNFNVVIYQASGTQLFLLDEDGDSISLGPIEQQGSLAGLPK